MASLRAILPPQVALHYSIKANPMPASGAISALGQLTARAQQQQRDLLDAYSLGVNSYIVKPVDFDRFVETTGQIGRYWFELNQPPI